MYVITLYPKNAKLTTPAQRQAYNTCYDKIMDESFADILAVGGKTNSLGRAAEVLKIVLADKSRLEELYSCLFNEDAWVRMRAADALEKVCREHPDWLVPYIDRFATELTPSNQPSIQWHLAQMYQQITLTTAQKKFVIDWLRGLLSTTKTDWIASANAMVTLVQFTKDGSVSKEETLSLLQIQQHHTSNSVVKRATKLLAALTA